MAFIKSAADFWHFSAFFAILEFITRPRNLRNKSDLRNSLSGINCNWGENWRVLLWRKLSEKYSGHVCSGKFREFNGSDPKKVAKEIIKRLATSNAESKRAISHSNDFHFSRQPWEQKDLGIQSRVITRAFAAILNAFAWFPRRIFYALTFIPKFNGFDKAQRTKSKSSLCDD